MGPAHSWVPSGVCVLGFRSGPVRHVPYNPGMAQNDARLEIRLPRALLERVDAVRGGVSRALWVRRAVESALRSGVPVASDAAAGAARVRRGLPPVSESWRR